MPILIQEPQTYLEFTKLINIMITKRFEIFMMKNIKTRWISMLSLAKMVVVEYWTHFMKMGIDMDVNSQVVTPLNIWPIWMSYCSWLVSSLSWKWSIISSFFQGNDNFICKFVSLVKICQALLYSMFFDLVQSFRLRCLMNTMDC